MTRGSRLRLALARRGFSATELAKRADISQQMASAMLNDQRPGDRHLGAIAKALGDESLLEWLFDGSNPPPWAIKDGSDSEPPEWQFHNPAAFRIASSIGAGILVDLPERRSSWAMECVLPLILALNDRLQNPDLTPSEFMTLDTVLFLFAEGLIEAKQIALDTSGSSGKEITSLMKEAAVEFAKKWICGKRLISVAESEKLWQDIRTEQKLAKDIDQAAEQNGQPKPSIGLQGDLPE